MKETILGHMSITPYTSLMWRSDTYDVMMDELGDYAFIVNTVGKQLSSDAHKSSICCTESSVVEGKLEWMFRWTMNG